MKKTNAIITVLSVILLLLAANYLASRHPARIDLTQQKIYTLSGATKKILSGLDDVVTIRAYFTREMPPALENLRRDVEDTLAEFKSAAGSRLQVEFIDPGLSVMEEQQAAMIGIPPVQLNVIERDKAEVAKVFLGLAVLYGGRQQVIPVVRRIDDLEYDLAEAILRVSTKELPKVAWWEGDPGRIPGAGFTAIREAAARRYSLEDMGSRAAELLDSRKFSTLVLISPRGLSVDERFALDQFVMGGGRVVALIDRFDVIDGLKLVPVKGDAAALFGRYGAKVEDSLVVDQQNAMAAFGGGLVTYHLPYPYWPELRQAQFDDSNPAVSGLESIVLPWTSPLKVASGEAASIVLARSTPFSAAVAGAEARLDPQSASNSLVSGKRGELDLAAMLEGPFGSVFAPGGEPPPNGRAVTAESTEKAMVFVIGSSHWISDRTLTTFPQNAAFFENILDLFAMGDALIGIRARSDTLRPIAPLNDAARAVLKYANIAAGPLLVLAIGATVFFIRRRSRRAAVAAYR